MNAKHTPGPWAYHKWMASGTNYGIETADHRHGLAAITPNGNASTLISLSEHEANARLIAAAPELLEALRNLLAYANKYSDTMAEKLGRGAEELGELADSSSVAGMARAAIAKATGGDHA